MIKFYNTLTRKTDDFAPIIDNKVSLYTCGPTVYSAPHIGNWASFLRWDILVRALTASDYDVTRVMNITDVGHLVSDANEGEDKMEKGARREGLTAWQVAKKYTDEFLQGMSQLGCIEPTYITKATDFINEQIEFVKILEQKGYTYKTSDGIYFDTSKFPYYANFARLKLDNLKEGARVEVNIEKRNTSDFALWKFNSTNQKRDMEWESPWGKGFPGWHLECSVMALAKLGKTLDIHTGGIDHIPVHHTNEIAQSECANGVRFANYWLHNSHIMIDGTKVSKSLGNTYTLQDLLSRGFSPNDFRMFVLQSHYRTESNFTWDNLQAAKNRLNKWKQIADLRWQATESHDKYEEESTNEQSVSFLTSAHNILLCLQNDLDTPEALVAAEDGLNIAERKGVDINSLKDFEYLLDCINNLLGLDIKDSDITSKQKELIAQREQARANKDWAKSDKLRGILLKDRISLNDSKYGTFWSKAR